MLARMLRPVVYQRLAGGVARPRRFRYSASGDEVLTPADFRTLTPATALSWLEAQGFAHARGTTAWMDDTDGDWVEIGGNLPLVTDRGLAVPQAFINMWPDSAFSTVVEGEPGSGPTGITFQNYGCSVTERDITTVKGLPAVRVENVSPGGNHMSQAISFSAGTWDPAWVSFAAVYMTDITLVGVHGQATVTSGVGESVQLSAINTPEKLVVQKVHVHGGYWYSVSVSHEESSSPGRTFNMTLAAPQCILGSPMPVHVISGGSTTASAAELVQRTVAADSLFYGAIQAVSSLGFGLSTAHQWLWQRANEAGTKWVGVYKDATAGKLWYSVNDGTTETKADLGTLANSTRVAISFAAAAGAHQIILDGVAETPLDAPMPTELTVESIGQNATDTGAWNGIIERFATASGAATETWLLAQGAQT